MEIRELRTFLALAETLNYQKASERLGYAPSTLSHHIKSLETELGACLFVKVGKQIQATQEAEAFLPHANRLLADYEAAVESVGSVKTTQEKVVIGGCESTIGNGLVDLFSSFTEGRRNIRLRQHTSANAQVPDMIREKNADVGVYYSREAIKLQGLQDQGLFMEPLWLIVGRDHPFSGRESVRLDELKGQNFAFAHDDCPCVTMLGELLAQRSVLPGTMHYLGVVPLVVEKIRAGEATVMPYTVAMRFEKVYDLVPVRIDEEDVWMHARLVCRSFDTLQPAAKLLVQHSLRYAKKLIERDGAHFRPSLRDAQRTDY